jgi:hypothetical protein
MSNLKVNTINDASGGSNAVLYGVAAPANSMGFRNRIINGDMRIDQRNAGASVPGDTNIFGPDRFRAASTQNSKFTMQQNAGSVTPPAGFKNYLGITSSSAYSVLAGDYFLVGQPVEGFNTSDLGFGAAGASTVTLSFWVRSSLTGTFGGAINNSSFNRSYPFSYTISSANTWEQKFVTITGDTTGTWIGATNGVGLYLWLNLGTGSTGSTTANAWAAGAYYAPTGATSVVGTSGATFYITGVQLEAGSVASPFERRDYGRELMMCQRYLPAVIAESTLDSLSSAVITSTTAAYVTLKHPVTARTRPTGVTASAANIITVSGASVTSAIAFNNAGTEYTTLVLTSSGLTTGVAAATFLNTAGSRILLTGCEL